MTFTMPVRCHRESEIARVHCSRIGNRAQGISETSPVNIADTIDGARRAFEITSRGCLVRFGEDEPRYATASANAPVHQGRNAIRCNRLLNGAPRLVAQTCDGPPVAGPHGSARKQMHCLLYGRPSRTEPAECT